MNLESKKGLTGRVLPCQTYTLVGDDMTWPSYNQGDLEWQLRYGSEEQIIAARLRLASIVSAYKSIIDLAPSRRDAICRAIRDAR